MKRTVFPCKPWILSCYTPIFSGIFEISQGLNTLVNADISYKLNFEFKNENQTTNNNQTSTTKISDLVSALKALGYKKEEVEIALSEIPLKIENYRSMELSDLVSETIKIIIGGNESNSIKAN